MRHQTTLPERIFGLAVVDGRRTVRPGAVVRFRFRARNASEIATPRARLTFALPPGWSALDPLEVEIPPVRPGGDHERWFAVRPDVADATTALSHFQAALHLDDMVLGSNVVTVRVTGSPCFRAPASGVRVDAAPDARLRVAVTVVNEGDAAARDVTIVAPPPPGFRALAATTANVPALAPGASFAFAYEMEPVAPASPIVRVDDACVSFDGGRTALTTAAAHRLAPGLAAPAIAAVRAATRLDTTIRIANDGWVPARDVDVTVELPAGWRILRGTTLADGAPATIRRDAGAGNNVTLALPFVPARGAVAVSVVSSAVRPKRDGSIVVRCGAQASEAPIPEPVARALRLDARPASPFAIPGATLPIAIDAFNNGETRETIAIALDGVAVWHGAIDAGASVAFVAHFTAPAESADGDVTSARIDATGADGVALASATLDLRVVDRPWLAVDDVRVDGSDARVVVRNVGATTARDVRLEGERGAGIEALAPGDVHVFALSAQSRPARVVSGGGDAIAIPWDLQPEPVPVDAELLVAPSLCAGQRLDIHLRCVAAATLETLRIRPQRHVGAIYVAGSTSVNGYAIVDGVDGPPLLLGDGLALHDVPADTVVEIAWSLLPRTPGELRVAVEVEANGTPIELADARVWIDDPVPFGARPAALPFHIEAATVAGPGATAAESAVPATIAPIISTTFVVQHALDDERIAAIRRVLRGSRGPGILAHLPAIAVLLPTAIGADPVVNDALGRATDAIRSVYERLFVKLRIPGYDVTPFDLEDNGARRELAGFCRVAAGGSALPPYGSADLHVTLTAAALAAARDALADAPLGGPVALTAIGALLPRGGTGVLAAVGAYVDALAAELAATRAHADDAFRAYVVGHRAPALDAARDAALTALDSRVPAGG